MEEKLNKLLSAVSPLDDAAMEKARERQAQLAMEQLPEAVREEMQEFDHQQELSERRWKKHHD